MGSSSPVIRVLFIFRVVRYVFYIFQIHNCVTSLSYLFVYLMPFCDAKVDIVDDDFHSSYDAKASILRVVFVLGFRETPLVGA